ncbi:unnamed protein product [Closterium sp. NIES-54]
MTPSSYKPQEPRVASTGGAVGAAGGTAGAAGGAASAGGATGAAGGAAVAGGATGAIGGAAGAGGGTRGAAGASGGAAGAGAAAAGAAGRAGGAAGTGDPEAEGTGPVSAVSGGVAWPRLYYVLLLQQVLSSPPSPGPPHFLSPPPVRSQSQLQQASPLPGPSPYSGPTRGLTERREPESRPVSPASRAASPVRTTRAGRVSRPRLPPVPGTHSMTLRPSTAPQRVSLPSPPASSLPDGPETESDSLRATSPTVTCFLATAVSDPLFESSAASALVAELVDFAAACRLDYAASLVAESGVPGGQPGVPADSLSDVVSVVRASPLPGPSPYSGPTRGLTERREPESRPVSPASRAASPVRTTRAGRVSRPRLPPVPGTHSMTLRPSTAPQRVSLPSPPASSLPDGPETESDSLRATSPTVTRFLATAVSDPLFESSAASALVAELVDFAAACRLDYAASLVAESVSASVCPLSVEGECALGMDVLEDRQEDLECFSAASPHLMSMLLAPEGDPDAPDIPTPRSYAEAIEGPYSSQWQAAMDTEMASWKSTGTYVDEVPPPGGNIVSGMWIFRVKRSPGSPPAFKARYVARGFSQRQGVDFFQTFSPTPKMTTLRRDYELHSLDFSTAFLQGSLHEEIWLRRPPGFTGSFPSGTQWSLRRPVYGLRQAPREWHDTLRTTLAALGFAPSTADPSMFLRTDTTLPPFYVLVYVDDLVFATADTEALAHVKFELQKRHTCTDLAPPSDESVEPSGPYPELVGCLITSGMGLVLGGRARVVLTGHADASWVNDLAMQRSSQGYTFSLGSSSVSWQSTRSSSNLSSSCEAEIYAGAMAAQELRWLTYLLADLGEAPRSPPVLYVNNKAMLALCQEHRLEHRTKHIALRYFLARELQQRGHLRLAYVASQTNTADVFTKALQPCDHQRFFEGKAKADKGKVVATVMETIGGGPTGKRKILDFFSGEVAEAKSRADEAISLFFTGLRIPEHHADHPLFRNMLRAVAEAGSGYVPPGRKYIGGSGLQQCRIRIEEGLAPIKKTWGKQCVTIDSRDAAGALALTDLD